MCTVPVGPIEYGPPKTDIFWDAGMTAYVKKATTSTAVLVIVLIPFSTAVPLWGQSIQIISSLSPKRAAALEGLKTLGGGGCSPVWGGQATAAVVAAAF